MSTGPDETHRGWHHFEGPVTGNAPDPTDDSIDDDAWDSAGTPLAAGNQQHRPVANFNQLGTAVSDTIPFRTIMGAGTISAIKVSNLTACAGSSTVTVDIQKDGVSVLSSVITLDLATLDGGTEEGLLDGAQTTVVANEILTAVITTNVSGTDALCADIVGNVEFSEANSI